MAFLATPVQPNTNSYYFALAGSGGGGTAIQSPASVTPAGDGTVRLNMIQSTGATPAGSVLSIASTNGNNAGINIVNTAGGNSYVYMGQASAGVGMVVGGVNPSQLNVVDPTTGTAYMSVDCSGNNVVIGASSQIVGVADGTVTLNQALVIRDTVVGTANGLGLSPTSGTASVISQLVANSGTLNIGSSAAATDTLVLSDTGGTGVAKIGGNGGADLYMLGGNGTTILPNIRTEIGNTGTITIGSSQANALTMYIRDGAGASSGFVDITGGVGNETALRLQGANTNQGSATSTSVSTNLAAGSGAVLNLTPNANDGSLPAIKLQGSIGGGGSNSVIMNSPLYLNAPASGFGSYVPILLRAPQVSSGTFDVDLSSLPTGISLVYGFSAVSPPSGPDNTFMFSVMVYTNPVDNIVGGGAINSSSRYEIVPSLLNGKALTVQLGGTSSANWGIYGITLLGL